MVEYTVAVILLALAISVAVRYFGGEVEQKYDCAGAHIDNMSGTFQKAGCTGNAPAQVPPPPQPPRPTAIAVPKPTPAPAPKFVCYTCHTVSAGQRCPPGTTKRINQGNRGFLCIVPVFK